MRLATFTAITHLLSVRNYGVVGLAATFTGVLSLLSNFGSSVALIREVEPSQKLKSTLFWVNVAVGFSFAVLVYLLAPAVSEFYRTTAVRPLIRLSAVTFLASSVGVVPAALLARDLRFRAIGTIEFVSAFVGSAVAVACAATGVGAASLIWQSVIAASLTSASAIAAAKWRPSFAVDLRDAKQAFAFSANVTGFAVVNYLARNGDNILIGRFVGATQLGYYALAYNLMLFPIQMISFAVGRAAYPAFAAVQDDPSKMGRGFLRVCHATAALSFPLMGGLAVLSHATVAVVFGQRWLPVAVVLAVLAPVGAFQSISGMVGDVFQARNRTGLQLKLGLANTALCVAAFAVGLEWGIVGVAVGFMLVTSAFTLYPTLPLALRLVDQSRISLWQAVRGPAYSTTALILVVSVAKLVTSSLQSPGATLGVCVPCGLGAYVLAEAIFDRSLLSELLVRVGLSGRG